MTTPETMGIWFGFSSSYSYLAVMRAKAAAHEAGVTRRWRPSLLGPVFLSLGGNHSPINIYPPKGRYMWRDMARLAEKHDIPFKMPTQFPRNGLLACRAAHAGQDEDWVGPFSRASIAANFVEDRDIGERSVIADILTGLDLPADSLLERAVSPENKVSLRAQNEQAGKLGLFGAPNFMVDGELFWGNDRLDDALV